MALPKAATGKVKGGGKSTAKGAKAASANMAAVMRRIAKRQGKDGKQSSVPTLAAKAVKERLDAMQNPSATMLATRIAYRDNVGRIDAAMVRANPGMLAKIARDGGLSVAAVVARGV